MDLKQKQANFNQALVSTNHAGAMKQQLRLLTKQAEESDKQSKALMVFTVVTIVFVGGLMGGGELPDLAAMSLTLGITLLTTLREHQQLPSSFLAAVFAINLDAFPLNENGKLPLGYFLKFLCTYSLLPVLRNPLSNHVLRQDGNVDSGLPSQTVTISFAACFPLLFIAFNLDVVGRFWATTKHHIVRLWRTHRSILLFRVMPAGIVLGTFAGALIAIWTSPLGGGIKAGLTTCLILFLLLTIFGWGIWKVFDIARREISMASGTRGTELSPTLDA